MLSSAQQLAPGYTNLNLQNLNSTLNGTAGQQGYAAQYAGLLPQITGANTAAAGQAAQGAAANLGQYGPQAVNAIRALNPGQASIYDLLNTQATQGLQAGNQMTPDQQRQLNNSVLSSQATRGMAYGPAASYQQVLANSQYGDNLLQQRQNTAGNVANLGNSLYTLPGMNMVLGASGATGQAGNLLGMGNANAGAGQQTFSQLGGYANDLFNTNYNAQASSNINSANARNSMYGNLAGIGGAGLGALGSYFGMAALAA